MTYEPPETENLSDDSAPAQRKSDRHETFANTRARRLALVLMGMSSMVTLAIAAAIWLAVR